MEVGAYVGRELGRTVIRQFEDIVDEARFYRIWVDLQAPVEFIVEFQLVAQIFYALDIAPYHLPSYLR